ncbi:MAG: LysR family transcriptional regulator [Oceanospirillaceae bacterium]|nr:LysR family transcriptional regulator [Oceanospirillaceae bacterium]
MELKWLEDFISLSTTGNFRISSEQRFVSQPAFSRRIKSLETWVGAELIDRSIQPVTLTEPGREFKPIAQLIISKAYQIRSDIRGQSIELREHLNFSSLSTLAQFFIPHWLKQHSDIFNIDFISVRSDFMGLESYLASLDSAETDFFIGYQDKSQSMIIDPLKYSSLLLATELLLPVVSPDPQGNPRWWLPDKPKAAIPYLRTNSHTDKNHSHLYWSVGHHIQTHYAELSFNTVYEASCLSAIKAMVLQGFGVAWLPLSMVKDDLASGALLRAADTSSEIQVDIKIFKSTGNHSMKLHKYWQALSAKHKFGNCI